MIFGDPSDEEGPDRDLPRVEGRESRMPLYIAGVLVAVSVLAEISHHLLTVSQREFDIVATEIKTSLYQLNVPGREMGEFMTIIESDRSMVVHPSHQQAG